METEVRNDLERVIGQLNTLAHQLYEIRSRRWRSDGKLGHQAWTNKKRKDARELQKPFVDALTELNSIPLPGASTSNNTTRTRYESAWVYGLSQLALIDGPDARRMAMLFRWNCSPSMRTRIRVRAGYLVARYSYSMSDDS